MIQDIFPHKLDNSFKNCIPGNDDILLFFDSGGRLLADIENTVPEFISVKEYSDIPSVYLFSVDERRYFLALSECTYHRDNYDFYNIRELRSCKKIKPIFQAQGKMI